MNTKEYIGDLTAGALFVTESRVVAESLLQHLSEEDWKELMIDRNILQKRSPNTSIRYARAIRRRLQRLGDEFLQTVIDALIPFYCFYAPIESFLEPAVKRTIDQAFELDSLTGFDSKILKTLFLIRYVDTVKSTLDNLVTLSIEHIDADKISLKRRLEESLNRLDFGQRQRCMSNK